MFKPAQFRIQMKLFCCLFIFLTILRPTVTFSPLMPAVIRRSPVGRCFAPQARRFVLPRAQQRAQEPESAKSIDSKKVEMLFAWLNRAFAGDDRYNNLVLAFAALFSEDAKDTSFGQVIADITKRPEVSDTLVKLVDDALAELPTEDTAVGPVLSLRQREKGCLGAMGAGQWTGQYRTRPHALLDVREFATVDEWAKSLPRGARRTLAKANEQNFTVVNRPIYGDKPAPHSSLGHFRCVIEHEVRLLADSPDNFFDALQQGIGRYQNCIMQGGEIREYRDADGRVIAFAHEMTKGKVMRGQWFYSTDDGAKRYVWFHSVQELVRRAIQDQGVDFADLGPSGSDAFSVLKEKYGFKSVADWHKVADYRGPFRYEFGQGKSWAELDPPDYLFETSVLERILGKDPRSF